MSKQSKKPKAVDSQQIDLTPAEGLDIAEQAAESAEQAVENAADFAKKSSEPTASSPEASTTLSNESLSGEKNTVAAESQHTTETPAPENAKAAAQPSAKSSGGKAIGVLALLVALAIGGAGHFLTNKKFAEVEAQIAALKQAPSTQTAAQNVVMPNFDAEKAQLAQLAAQYQQSLDKIHQLEQLQANYTQQINGLQSQLAKLGAAPKADTSAWLLSEADFLLNNAQRKMVLDNDLDTAKTLLIEADGVLNQLSGHQVQAVRDALKVDLKQLNDVNRVDQNNLMQRLAQLANQVDEMPMLDNESLAAQASGEVSDSLADWQKNIEKSADSFLSHFIRVSDKKQASEKAFIAPNQEIYLRENIRLRLQIAILAVPRQQNELYKQSLDAVGSWVRSYFDGQNGNVKSFLKEVDELIEQSIYIDAPTRLQSLTLLENALNKAPQAVEKIQLDSEKTLAELKVEAPESGENAEKAAEPAASSQPAQTPTHAQ